ncbi:sulfatase-like hydrolase/transferase [Gandjariella thermophila]|uniref:Sulfatase N-terminal domain-containing protein n=1 Tax=Gandjariella thermophila TaxID=1931992 RepID=A0A4D4J4F3_9PSEU|nr:sulfatase-like hydrolase/transferase [Gandjariella thermophila]GDY28833.1 hypothetical protein GTS_04660 [Gandjariella thermophila]
MSLFTNSRRPTTEASTATPDGSPAENPAAEGAAAHDLAADGAPADPAAPDGQVVDDAPASPADGGGRRAVLARVINALALLFVLFALILPNDLNLITPGAFLRVPVEGLLGAAFLLLLRGRLRLIAAVLMGVGLGALSIVRVIDMGFFAVLARPFDPVLDGNLLGEAVGYLNTSIGRLGAIGAVIAAAVLTIAVLTLTTLAVLRLTRLLVRHEATAFRGIAALAVVWVTCAALGAQSAPGIPTASRAAAGLAYHHAAQVRASVRDEQEFDRQAAVDPFASTPADQLLTALRGKDVVVTFVESYGRSAIEDPEFAPQVNAVLDDGNRRLAAAGYAAKSGFLTSPVYGSGSWLAHATFLSGLWVDNQQRYRTLTSSNRLTLSRAFHRANWDTVAVQPGTNRAWPEGAYYGFQRTYNDGNLGYRGPGFGWSPMPDQYTLLHFQNAEYGKPNRPPFMAEIDLTSSHIPWAPLPQFIDWKDVGDGSVYGPIAAHGDQQDAVWRDPERVRAAYRQSIEYSLTSLFSYLEKYGNDNLVMIFLGDHQPIPLVTGGNPSRDVPITIVAKDRQVLDRISGWGWQDGLKPGSQAPVWPMSAFRDRFLTAFGSQASRTH